MNEPALTGGVLGSVMAAAIVMVGATPLLRAARMRRRLATLALGQAPAAASSSDSRPPTRYRRTVVILVVVTAVVATASPPLAVAIGAGGWVWPRWRAAARVRRHEQAVLGELPEVVDLLLIAVASGLNLRLAIEAVGERGPPQFGAALRRAAADIGEGARVADAVEAALVPLGDSARPLATAILGSARYGMSLTAALDRLAIETRQLRRRQAEEAIRRVPVKLLFPLVLLVLPAFVLLTVVPLLASALRSLPL
jgi:tight adherence protein C